MSNQQPPPLPTSGSPTSRTPKRSGCSKGCLIIGGVGILLFALPAGIGLFQALTDVRQKAAEFAEKQPEEQRMAQEVEPRKAADLAKKQREEAAPREPVVRPLYVTPARPATRAPQHVEAHQSEIDLFLEVVAAVDRHTVIASLRSKPGGPPWRLTITVNEQWDNLPRATQLSYARTFRGAWAGVWPPEPGGAEVSIDIVNGDGKTVGGGTRSEATVWVD